MSEPRFIFNTIDYQNGANTFNNYVENQDAVNNAAATGNTFKFRTDADRMKALIGTKGKSRLSGYYNGLYVTLYAITVTQPTLPSINGPGGSGWGGQLWSGPIQAININDEYLQKRTGLGNYVGVKISGYIYSPVATTIQFQTVSDDGVVVTLNGVNVITAWIYQGPTKNTSAVVDLNPGYNSFSILFFEGAGGAVLQFNYSIAGGPPILNLCDCFYNYKQM